MNKESTPTTPTRFRVQSYKAGKKRKFGIVDTAVRRWVNLCWSTDKEAEHYARHLNVRGAARIPLAGRA